MVAGLGVPIFNVFTVMAIFYAYSYSYTNVKSFIVLNKSNLGVQCLLRYHLNIYSRTSMVRTLMARLPWLFRTRS